MNSTNTQQFDSFLSSIDTTAFCDLTDFIRQDKQYPHLKNNWKTLSVALIHFLKEHPEYINNWGYLCTQFWALPILMANPNRISTVHENNNGWVYLSKQKWALPLLTANTNMLLYTEWGVLCAYEWALPLLMDNPDKIPNYGWDYLSTKEWALPLLMANPKMIPSGNEDHNYGWYYLSSKGWAQHLLKTNSNLIPSMQQSQLELLSLLGVGSTQTGPISRTSVSSQQMNDYGSYRECNVSMQGSTQRMNGRSIGSVVADFTPNHKQRERYSGAQDSGAQDSTQSGNVKRVIHLEIHLDE